jgi:hypothetical protein
MKGNFHVRFLEGDGLAIARPYSVHLQSGGRAHAERPDAVDRDSADRRFLLLALALYLDLDSCPLTPSPQLRVSRDKYLRIGWFAGAKF